jgi:hypothetical protein
MHSGGKFRKRRTAAATVIGALAHGQCWRCGWRLGRGRRRPRTATYGRWRQKPGGSAGFDPNSPKRRRQERTGSGSHRRGHRLIPARRWAVQDPVTPVWRCGMDRRWSAAEPWTAHRLLVALLPDRHAMQPDPAGQPKTTAAGEAAAQPAGWHQPQNQDATSMMLVLLVRGRRRRTDMADRRRNRRVCGRRRARWRAWRPGSAARRCTARRAAGKSATRRRTARVALPAAARRRPTRMDRRTATPCVIAVAAGVTLIQVARDTVRCVVPIMSAVPIAPAPTVEDQRHGRALDGQGW